MKKIIFVLWPIISVAGQLPPTPFPVFLKAGFSSVLEFDEIPVRVVLGDGQSFQVEKVDHSIVVRTLAPYAASNMFVYFKESQPRLFILTASEDANPTYYKKFDKEAIPKTIPKNAANLTRTVSRSDSKHGYTIKVAQASFDAKKDYLTVECELGSQSKEVLKPNWNLMRVTYKGHSIAPFKLWSERQNVQKDSIVKFRLIFAKPNLPRDLKGVTLVVPIFGQASAISILIRGEQSK